jgi:hypothetical protein
MRYLFRQESSKSKHHRPKTDDESFNHANNDLWLLQQQPYGSLPLDAIRRPRDTPIWKLEESLKCRGLPEGALRATGLDDQAAERQEITPDKWVHPSEEC